MGAGSKVLFLLLTACVSEVSDDLSVRVQERTLQSESESSTSLPIPPDLPYLAVDPGPSPSDYAPPAAARSHEDRIRERMRGVVGLAELTCLSATSYYSNGSTNPHDIVTRYTFHVKSFFGPTVDSFELRGGTIDGVTRSISHQAKFRVGRTYLATFSFKGNLLEPSNWGELRPDGVTSFGDLKVSKNELIALKGAL